MYHGRQSYDCNVKRKTDLFIAILQRIKNESTHTLEIAVEQVLGPYWDRGARPAALEYVTKQIDCSSISTLIWRRDIMGNPEKSFSEIAANFHLHFPNLEHFMIGANSQRRLNSSPALRFGCIQPVLSTNPNHLVSLNLQCPAWNLLESRWKAVESISSIKTLRKLSICSLIDDNAMDIDRGIVNPFVEELSLRFKVEDTSEFPGERFMNALISVFVGVRKLKFEGLGRTNDNERSIQKVLDWNMVFGALFRSNH